MTRYLLDTHTILWLANEPEKLSSTAQNHINTTDDLLISLASVWEMAIKIKTGKLSIAIPLEEFATMAAAKHFLNFLPISLAHIYHTQQLELRHRDPFDRLIIAQSITENIPVIGSDAQMDAYGITRIW